MPSVGNISRKSVVQSSWSVLLPIKHKYFSEHSYTTSAGSTSDCANRIINLAGAKEDVEKIPVDTIQKMKSLEELRLDSKSYQGVEGVLPGVQILFDNNANTLKKMSLLHFNESNSLRINRLENLQSLALCSIQDQKMILDILKNVSSNLKYLSMRNCDLKKLAQLERELNVRELTEDQEGFH